MPKPFPRRWSKLVFSIFNCLIVLAIVISGWWIFNQVVIPTIDHLQTSKQLFNNLNQTISSFSKFQSLEDLFNPEYGIISELPTTISPAAAQQAWTNFDRNFNQIIDQLKQLDQSEQIFSVAKQLATSALKTINTLAQDLDVKLNDRGLVGLVTISDLTTKAQDLDRLTTQWLNFSLDQILTIFQNTNSTQWQEVLKSNFNQFAASRLFIMVLTIVTLLITTIIIYLALIIISCKWRISLRSRFNKTLLNLNIIANLTIILAPITWLIIKPRKA